MYSITKITLLQVSVEMVKAAVQVTKDITQLRKHPQVMRPHIRIPLLTQHGTTVAIQDGLKAHMNPAIGTQVHPLMDGTWENGRNTLITPVKKLTVALTLTL